MSPKSQPLCKMQRNASPPNSVSTARGGGGGNEINRKLSYFIIYHLIS